MTFRDLLAWNDTVEKIQGKLSAAMARVAELQQERTPLALDAALDDAPARKRLDKLTVELREAEQAVIDLTAALAQAQRKVAEAEAQKREAAEQERLGKIRTLTEQRAKLIESIEGHVTGLATVLDNLSRLDREIVGLAGGSVVGWYTEAGRLLHFDAVQNRLLHYAGPLLHRWLRTPNRGIDPSYRGRSLITVEQEAVDACLFGKEPMRKAAPIVAPPPAPEPPPVIAAKRPVETYFFLG